MRLLAPPSILEFVKAAKRKHTHYSTHEKSRTMASPYNSHSPLKPKVLIGMLVLPLVCHVATEAAADIHLRGEVGRSVTFHCPADQSKTITFFYFQKGNGFVNGYHISGNISIPTWENTRLDQNDKTAVHMNNLNVTHNGDYKCYIGYSDDSHVETVIKLSVTANYSKPNVTQSCGDGLSCVVNCVSYGGYPRMGIRWHVPGSSMWMVENSSEMQDPDIMTVNSSSTVSFNCSSGELRSIRCSAGDATSDFFSVCTPTHQPGINPLIWAALCVLCSVVIAVLMLPLWLRKCKKRRRREEMRENVFLGENEHLRVGGE